MKMSQGFTIIELMITLLLSSMLVAAIGKVFIDSSNSFRKQKTLSYLVEDGRYAQDILTKEIRRAGYLRNRKTLDGAPDKVFVSDGAVLGSGLSLAETEFIKGGFDSTGFDGDVFDINHLIFRYQLNDTNDLPVANTSFDLSPCTRNIHLTASEDPATQKIVVTLYYHIAFDSTLSTPVLYCRAKRVNLDDLATPTSNPVSDAIPLISNVESLHILYGIDTDSDTYANQYLRADQLSSAEWLQVVSIRLYVVLMSEEKNIGHSTPKYTLDGRDYTVNSPGDKRLYKVFNVTVAIRNQLL